MIRKILRTLQEVLSDRWDQRLPQMLARSENIASINLAPKEAYLAGYRDGYWEGVSDLVEAGLERRVNKPFQEKPILPKTCQ